MKLYGRAYQYVLRALSWFPAGPALELFCNLLHIEESDRVPGAAVVIEKNRAPYILINPRFVETVIQHDAWLALLLLHEIFHVLFSQKLLGNSLAHNIAFDAVINAYLSRRLLAPVYRGFFEAVNNARDFPGALLRPPVGWPDAPVYPQFKTPGATGLLKRLYPPREDIFSTPLPTTLEVLDILLRSQPPQKQDSQPGQGSDLKGIPMPGMMAGSKDDGTPDTSATSDETQAAERDEWKTPELLGNHDALNNLSDEQRALRDAFADAARQASEDRLSGMATTDGDEDEGYGPGQGFTRRLLKPSNPSANARRRFWKLLQYVARQSDFVGDMTRIGDLTLPAVTPGMIFNPRDRYAYARWQVTGFTLSRQPAVVTARHLPPAATLYLDVSGSMNQVIEEMLALVRPFNVRGYLRVFEFSTEVSPVENLHDVGSTGGTDIQCVLEHIVKHTRQIGQIIILTDGDFSAPEPVLVQQIKRLHKPIHVVLTDDNRDHLEAFATSFTRL